MRVFVLVLAMMFAAVLLPAQDTTQPNNQSTTQKPSEAPPAEAGGPTGDVGPIAVPKKKTEPPPPKEPKVKNPPEIGNYSIEKNVSLVSLDVQVKTKDGMFVPNLKAQNFKVLEDGVPQQVKDFKVQDDVPITAVLLVEFGSTNYYFMVDALRASYSFANTLKKDDWIAVVAYDMRPHMLVDFTQDKGQVYDALGTMRVPGFHEYNLFDSLYDTLDRIERVEGHKYVILISTGIDTFSKLRLNEILNKVKKTQDVTIFSMSIGWYLRTYCESHRCTGISHGMASYGMSQIDWLQADNQLQTFAKLTGGRFYQPRFMGDMVDAFKDISQDIRHEYTIAYHPTNQKQDGSYRKLKVEVVAPDGGPLKMKDQKGKDVKYMVIAREGYTAKHTVE